MAVNAEPTTVDYFIQLLKNKVQSSKPQLKATLPKIKTTGNLATNQNNYGARKLQTTREL